MIGAGGIRYVTLNAEMFMTKEHNRRRLVTRRDGTGISKPSRMVMVMATPLLLTDCAAAAREMRFAMRETSSTRLKSPLHRAIIDMEFFSYRKTNLVVVVE